MQFPLVLACLIAVTAEVGCARVPAPGQRALCRGNIRITSERDVTSLQACTDFVGTIDVQGGAVTSLSALSQLAVITGSLRIGPTTNLTTIAGLDALHTITGSLVIDTNLTADGVFLPRLKHVGGDLVMTENLAMTGISLPALTVVESRMTIAGNPALTRIMVTSLTRVGRDVDISANPVLELVQITAPLDIGGRSHVIDNPKLPRSVLEPQP